MMVPKGLSAVAIAALAAFPISGSLAWNHDDYLHSPTADEIPQRMPLDNTTIPCTFYSNVK